LRTNNAIFCTVIQFSALNLGGDFLELAIKYNNDRVFWYRNWTDLHESNRWDEDIKPYLLYLLLVGPTLIAARHNERTRFDPDPAAHMSMITKALCLAWSRVNRYLDLLIGDPTYSQLLLNNILSGVPSTGTALHSSTPVAALRAIVAQQNLPNDVSNGLHLAIDNVYRIRLSMIRAEQDNAASHPPNNINRFLPAWLSVNSSLPEAFWDCVSVANPHKNLPHHSLPLGRPLSPRWKCLVVQRHGYPVV
jgi:hypothetical protein